MNILSKVTWKSMWQNRTRTVVTIVGIILSAAMFMAVTTLGCSLWDYLVRRELYQSGDHYLKYHYTSQTHIDTLSQDERISKLGTLGILGYTESAHKESYSASNQQFAVAAADNAFFEMNPIRLEEGRLPENSSEILIDRNFYFQLQNAGKNCNIGDSVEINVSPEYAGEMALPSDGQPFCKTYTIVGIHEAYVHLGDHDMYISHLITFTDQDDAPLWYRVYVKTHAPKDAMDLLEQTPEGVQSSVNHTLLALYGVTYFQNYNTAIIRICCVLAAIIMVGSVSLIYNAFSISVSERTKQFGMLASIGATKRQIRASVFSEAMRLGLIGIPLGIIFGYAGIAITLKLLSPRIHTLLSTGNGTVYLDPVLSPLAIGIAAFIALTTILLSAAIPARKATKVTPLDAIRQKYDYQVPKKGIPASKLVFRFFGLPGVLSRKYYRTSKGKYRATVISLVISIVLFICAATLSQMIQRTVDRTVDTEAFDMVCYGDQETLEQLREQDFVEDSAYFSDDYYIGFAPDSMLSQDLLENWDLIHSQHDRIDKNMPDIRIVYLEDDIFRDYLIENNLDPEPYFSKTYPTALVIAKSLTIYERNAQDGTTNRYTYSYEPYSAEGELFRLIPLGSPSELPSVDPAYTRISTCDHYISEDGEPVLAIVPVIEKEDGRHVQEWENRVEYVIRWERTPDGVTVESYYPRNSTTGQVADAPALTQTVTAPQIRIGATVKKLPFGISIHAIDDSNYQYFVLPLSAATAPFSGPDLCITVSDYPTARNYLDINLGELNYRDYRESEEGNRTLVLLIHVFSYGFIILISMICVANVFNTISTNITLRRKDFGMLRSIGFRKKDLLRMMNYECLTYGFRALIWGLPMSLAFSFLLHRIDRGISLSSYTPPWRALLIASACVFLVVFITMFYAIVKLRKDNPIDAIRMENI